MSLLRWLAVRRRKHGAASHLRMVLAATNHISGQRLRAERLAMQIVTGACARAPVLMRWEGSMLAVAALYNELGDGEVPEGDIDGCVLALHFLVTSDECKKTAISDDDLLLLAQIKGYVHSHRVAGTAKALLEFERKLHAQSMALLLQSRPVSLG